MKTAQALSLYRVGLNWRDALQLMLADNHERFLQWNERRTIRSLLLLAGGLLGAAGLLWIGSGYHAGFHSLNRFTPWLPDIFWQSLTLIGDTSLGLVLVLFFARRNPAILWVIFIAALYGTPISHGLKELLGTLRPPAVLGADQFNLIGHGLNHSSFPSGHSLTIFVLISVLFCFSRETLSRLMLVAFGLLVAFSRVMVGAHWPVDVLCGSALGILVALMALVTARYWRWGFTVTGHLFILFLLLVNALILPWHDGGYPLARPFALLVMIAALIWLVYDYRISAIAEGYTSLFYRRGAARDPVPATLAE